MADEAQSYGFRARMAQLTAWLFGQQQQTQQQQNQKSDRQVFDGYDRGSDDPDNRRQSQGPQPLQAPTERREPQQQRSSVSQEQGEALKAQADAFAPRLQAEQQRQRGRG